MKNRCPTLFLQTARTLKQIKYKKKSLLDKRHWLDACSHQGWPFINTYITYHFNHPLIYPLLGAHVNLIILILKQ